MPDFSDLPELSDDDTAAFTSLDLSQLFGENRPTNDGPPSEEEWAAVAEYRSHVEWAWQHAYDGLTPEEAATVHQQYDETVTNFLGQFRATYRIDTSNLRTLWALTLSAGIQFWFVSREILVNCGADQQVKAHGLHHLRHGALVYDFILRDDLRAAGAPDVPPAEFPGVFDQDA